MKHFLDLNYHFFSQKSINEIVDTYYANFGFLFYLKDDFETTSILKTSKDEFLLRENVNFISVKSKILKKIDYPKKVHKELNKFTPDFILVHGMRYGLFSFFLKRKFKKSIILVQVHGYADTPGFFKKILHKLNSRYVDGFLFTGKENALNLINANIIRQEKVFEIMEGSAALAVESNTEKIKDSFLWVGRLIEKKDPLTVLDAFEKYVSINSKAHLKMVFNSMELLNKVEEIINRSIGLKSRVELIGALDKKTLEKQYSKSEFFINGSHYEGSGYALLEAMSFGCIPIISKIPPHEFMTGYGKCGFLYQPKNTNELFNILKSLQTINPEKERFKIKEQFNKDLSFQAIANKITSIFEDISKRKDCK